jgi:hypothetical protein
MSERTARISARVVFALVCALWVFDAVLAYLTRSLGANTSWSTSNFLVGSAFGLMLLTFPLSGVLICDRRPGSRIGWLLLATGACWVISGATVYADYGLRLHPGSLPGSDFVAVIASSLWVPAIGLCGTYLLLLFPDGRLPSPRWRWVLHLSTFVMVAGVLSLALTPGLLGDAGYPDTVNPIGITSLATALDYAKLVIVLLPVAMCVSAASLVVRYRRAGPVERQQITWLAAAATVVVSMYAVVLPLSAFIAPSGPPPTSVQAMQAVALISFGLIPGAVLVAVLRYRLYEIDVLIRRTVTYAVLVAILGAGYLAGIWMLGAVLRSLTGASGAVAVTVSTLAVWAAFQPLRSRVQRVVDHRFARGRYDAETAVAGFSSRLRDQVDLDAIACDLIDTAHRTVQPRMVSVWLRAEDTPQRDREVRP